MADLLRVPSVPTALADHICLVHDTGASLDLWHFTTADGPLNVRVSGDFIANDSAAVRLAARDGYDIALLPETQVFDNLHAGCLVRLLNDYPLPRVPVTLVYPSRRNVAPRTRVVTNFLHQEYRQLQALLVAAAEVVN